MFSSWFFKSESLLTNKVKVNGTLQPFLYSALSNLFLSTKFNVPRWSLTAFCFCFFNSTAVPSVFAWVIFNGCEIFKFYINPFTELDWTSAMQTFLWIPNCAWNWNKKGIFAWFGIRIDQRGKYLFTLRQEEIPNSQLWVRLYP